MRSGTHTVDSPQTAIVGNGSANTLNGTPGSDLIIALARNDTLNGGAGADTMVGGAGNDTYVIDNAGDVMSKRQRGYGPSPDDPLTAFSLASLANVENLTFTGGTATSWRREMAQANTITGGLGNDTLDGGAGQTPRRWRRERHVRCRQRRRCGGKQPMPAPTRSRRLSQAIR